MSKTFKTICLLFALIFITVGCGTEKTQEVANYDEAYHVEQRDHYRSLHRYLSDEYENDLDDTEDGDLKNTDNDDEIRSDLFSVILRYQWNIGIKNYKLIEIAEDDLEEKEKN